jgi:DNA-binding XRE family transcriptional regulator
MKHDMVMNTPLTRSQQLRVAHAARVLRSAARRMHDGARCVQVGRPEIIERKGALCRIFTDRITPQVFAAGRRKQHAGALLGIGRRRWKAPIPTISLYRRRFKKVCAEPNTLEEHLKQKRVNTGLSIRELAELLEVSKRSMEMWETKKHAISPLLRPKIIHFLGYGPTEILRTQHAT